jgi:holo-[acyl-carrier protein] synthase
MYPSGVGTDIIEIGRIEKAIEKYRQRFLDRIFTEAEQRYCLKYKLSARHFAGRFAAKEAIVKALGTGFKDGISWLDIEITNDHTGKPTVKLSEQIQKSLNSPHILLSISHCHEYATACAIYMSRG